MTIETPALPQAASMSDQQVNVREWSKRTGGASLLIFCGECSEESKTDRQGDEAKENEDFSPHFVNQCQIHDTTHVQTKLEDTRHQ